MPQLIFCKMQVIYDKHNFCINLDWLSFSVRLVDADAELQCPDGYRLELLTGNNIYKYRFILYDAAGRKLITALWHPYSSTLDKLVAHVQFANCTLYSEERFQLWDLLLRVWDCEFNSMSRIDICCDFDATDFQHGVIRRLGDGRCYVQGKREGSRFWHEENVPVGPNETKKRVVYHCISWGSKTSEIKVKLYWKSREQGMVVEEGQEPHPEKPYIVEEWRELGMNLRNVWRLEFSLSSSGQLSFDGKRLTLEEVLRPHWFCRVLSALLESRFVVRRNDGRRTSKHNNDRIVDFISLPFDKLRFRWKESSEIKYEDAANVSILRKLLQQLESPVCQANSIVFDSVADAIKSVVTQCHLEEWCQRRLGESIESYLDAKLELVGLGAVAVEPTPSRFE